MEIIFTLIQLVRHHLHFVSHFLHGVHDDAHVHVHDGAHVQQGPPPGLLHTLMHLLKLQFELLIKLLLQLLFALLLVLLGLESGVFSVQNALDVGIHAETSIQGALLLITLHEDGVLHDAVPHDEVLHDVILRDAVPHGDVLHDDAPHDAVPNGGYDVLLLPLRDGYVGYDEKVHAFLLPPKLQFHGERLYDGKLRDNLATKIHIPLTALIVKIGNAEKGGNLQGLPLDGHWPYSFLIVFLRTRFLLCYNLTATTFMKLLTNIAEISLLLR